MEAAALSSRSQRSKERRKEKKKAVTVDRRNGQPRDDFARNGFQQSASLNSEIFRYSA
jgi:hypothetical protein